MNNSYKIVQEHEIENKNEYFELLFLPLNKNEPSIYFSTNAENLEEVGKNIVNDKGIQAKQWRIVPHSKHHI
jgi:hypothetical protein